MVKGNFLSIFSIFSIFFYFFSKFFSKFSETRLPLSRELHDNELGVRQQLKPPCFQLHQYSVLVTSSVTGRN